jgi:hypothetical protein
MEDTYNTSKREKEEDGNEKGILGRWCWNGCRGKLMGDGRKDGVES